MHYLTMIINWNFVNFALYTSLNWIFMFMNFLWIHFILTTCSRNGSTRYNIRKETVWKICILFGYCSVFFSFLFFKQLCGNFKKRKNGFENTNWNKKRQRQKEREVEKIRVTRIGRAAHGFKNILQENSLFLPLFPLVFFTHFPTHYYYNLFFLFNTH